MVVAGLDMQSADNVVKYIIKTFNLDKEKIYCYSLVEDYFISYVGRQVTEIGTILLANTKETVDTYGEENDNGSEPQDEEVIENDIQKISVDEEQINEEVIATEIDSTITIKIEDVLQSTFDMIKDRKIYCATAYMRSLISDNDEVEEWYNKLAYAVNEPGMRCSYRSENMFSLYSSGADLYSEYLMVAAALRTFFMNHVSYDYDMKALHTNVKEISFVRYNSKLATVVYDLMDFKDKVHKGIDFYADYRMREQVEIERELEALSIEAKSYYDTYIIGAYKENKPHKRFLETRKAIFAQDGELSVYLNAVIEKDFELFDLVSEYLSTEFIKDDCSIESSNLDMIKLNKYVDSYWDKAGAKVSVVRKTSDLMGGLRNNLLNVIEKVVRVMCNWIVLVGQSRSLKDDEGSRRYKEIKRELIDNLKNACDKLYINQECMNEGEYAGAVVLEDTLRELIARLDGTYNECQYKYYYVDFLRGKNVLLDENFLPDMRGKFSDFQDLSLPNRILKHAKENLMTFEEKIEDIFKQGGEDYGTAKLIMRYSEEMGIVLSENYAIDESEERACLEAKLKLDSFIENLELAQSYGQIEETKENKKEKIQKIANEWFEYAKESHNYGFFYIVLDKYAKKIREDAKVRGGALSKEVERIKVQGNLTEYAKKRVEKIEEMINNQNYTVAEDFLSKINSEEIDEATVNIGLSDYLDKFINDYDSNYMRIGDSGRKLRNLISSQTRNKDDRGGQKLVDNWLNNGSALGQSKLNKLLDALGFGNTDIKERAKIGGKIENYSVTFRVTSNCRTNYKHPITAFGSKANRDGIRVVCLYGKYDADRLIEEFKNIAETKNTLVLLDYALPLADRRKLARKIKSDLHGKVFAVLDRVLLMFLVHNYDVQFINQILMTVMMPFSYYQPYVWDSSKVMPPEMFMGRKEELEKIESPTGVNIVYGGRQLGKSALLKMAKMNIDNNENYDRAVLVEIKGLDYEKAAAKIGHELYDAGVLKEDIDTTDWGELSRAIKCRLQSEEEPNISYLLLLLDEADTFIESCQEVNFQPFDALKEIQSVGMERFKFVIAGLHNIVRFKRDAVLSKNSVLTHLTSITVKPFGISEARELLEKPLYYLGFRFPEDKQHLVALILANANYFPGLIQLYCAKLIEAMRKGDYAGYDQVDTPPYEIKEKHIKKVLSDSDFMNQIREKFEITLKLDEDNMYYIIALMMAYLYHQNANSASENEGFSAEDIINVGKEYGVKKISESKRDIISGLMQELLELNILRQTVNDLYLFSRYSFFQMMGTATQVEDKLVEYMED